MILLCITFYSTTKFRHKLYSLCIARYTYIHNIYICIYIYTHIYTYIYNISSKRTFRKFRFIYTCDDCLTNVSLFISLFLRLFFLLPILTSEREPSIKIKFPQILFWYKILKSFETSFERQSSQPKLTLC
jgi:hypothetical protein